ncbi:Crp/Fnr family transcriptional regulator [Listeria newyorkensis]|uniref:Crp/Fnr family transcriptional regulator n=1 Tax=Listeria newyorkensis TaxID=1497681 RepID=A0A841YZB4_9LIST|nr:Crp/Fnr family transcriptional regulator [Listeria newyorkensis]MBC1458648.1 Crp/Fnr family transcriptional regulator [Listeria newyorkensis]
MGKRQTVITLQKEEHLEENGEYIILSGHLTCSMGKQLLCFLREGERALLHDQLLPDALGYQARDVVRLLKLESSMTNMRLEERYREFEKEIVDLMMERMEMLTQQKKQRLVSTLLKLGKEVGILEGENCRIPKVWNQVELASYINCTREYLLTQKRVLREEGVILDSHQWVLLDWERWTGKVAVTQI